MERGLNQRELARLLGVSFTTVLHWEKSQTEPRIKDMPSILQFVGYDPFPTPTTLSERMLAYRRKNGLDFEAAARQCGLCWETWMYWESAKNKKWWPSTRQSIEALLNVNSR
jgi:transcriptional regulator with XRE-family HTH domain